MHRRVVFDAPAERARARLRARYLGIFSRQKQEKVDTVQPQITQASATSVSWIEHPGRTPSNVARRGRPIRSEIEMRHWPESALRKHAPGVGRERVIALKQWYGGEGAPGRSLIGYAPHLR